MASEHNPVEEYLTEKSAAQVSMPWGGGSFIQNLRRGLTGGGAASLGEDVGKGLRTGGLAMAGALGVAGAGLAIQKVYDAATKARDFRTMLENNPDLAEKHKESPRLFNQMFSTLRTFNPAFSRDPVVAGSYMRQMVDDPMHAGTAVVEALGHRDKMKNPFVDRVLRVGSSKK